MIIFAMFRRGVPRAYVLVQPALMVCGIFKVIWSGDAAAILQPLLGMETF